ncbi:MAG: SPOR domain-containing protein [Candidatus Omnitrophota bacterium]
MRYFVIFLIGFFLGGFFGGDLGLLLNKTKNLISQKGDQKEKTQTISVVSNGPAPKPKVVEIVQPQPKPAEQKEVKAVPPKEAPFGREKVYSVQVASFKTREQAAQYVEQLVKQEFDAYIAPSRPSEPVNRYRVCIGETISMEQARALNTKLKPKFKDSFVYQF